MKIRNLINGYEYEAELTTTHSSSSYGQPVLVDLRTGEAIDKFSFACSEVLEASPSELKKLRSAGYLPKK
jgi:hypothetical protein